SDPGPPAAGHALLAWADARQWPLQRRLTEALDQTLLLPEFSVDGAPLSWRNWKAFARQTPAAAPLQRAFEGLAGCALGLRPLLEEAHALDRESFARLGQTRAELYARREGLSTQALRATLHAAGAACRAPFQRRFGQLGERIFDRPPGPAELHAMSNNLMYQPLSAPLAGIAALPAARRAFRDLGFDLAAIPLDLTDRPGKYAGAFCYPIQVPGDVRVSVKIASAHHLLDMLFHELGHAVHFSGIDPSLPPAGRHWITSGLHETYSTLFELLLDDPLFLTERLGLAADVAAQLAEFGRYKAVWVGTTSSATALGALEAWEEVLPWEAYQSRVGEHLLAFSTLRFPTGFACWEGFAREVSIYPAGYVLAYLRCAHWLKELRATFGPRWWAAPGAGDAIRARIRPGGALRFPDGWLDPGAFLAAYIEGDQGLEIRD
ncbi:MAG: hypothetical protein HY784_06955, partial [Chloroflexi bacterium]|nr:hypothetical protein [Chloroflexota bacterium]